MGRDHLGLHGTLRPSQGLTGYCSGGGPFGSLPVLGTFPLPSRVPVLHLQTPCHLDLRMGLSHPGLLQIETHARVKLRAPSPSPPAYSADPGHGPQGRAQGSCATDTHTLTPPPSLPQAPGIQSCLHPKQACEWRVGDPVWPECRL